MLGDSGQSCATFESRQAGMALAVGVNAGPRGSRVGWPFGPRDQGEVAQTPHTSRGNVHPGRRLRSRRFGISSCAAHVKPSR